MPGLCPFCDIVRNRPASTQVLWEVFEVSSFEPAYRVWYCRSEKRWLVQSETLLAFRDRSPAAKEHLLVIPKRHVPTINSLTREDYHLGICKNSSSC